LTYWEEGGATLMRALVIGPFEEPKMLPWAPKCVSPTSFWTLLFYCSRPCSTLCP